MSKIVVLIFLKLLNGLQQKLAKSIKKWVANSPFFVPA